MIVGKRIKEQIDKLPQLDRIEFRQKYDAVEKWDVGVSWLWNFILFITISFAFCTFIMIGISQSSNNPSILKDFVMALKPIFFLIVVGAGFCSFLFLIQEAMRSKMHRKLWDEYFETKVRKKDSNQSLKTTFTTTVQTKKR